MASLAPVGSPTRMYVMPCACGIVWRCTRAVSRPDDYCEMQDLKGRKVAGGCGRRLPEPRPEVRT